MSVNVMGIEPGSAVEMVVETMHSAEFALVAQLAREQQARFMAEAAKTRAKHGSKGVAAKRLTFRGGGATPVIGDNESSDTR